MEVEESFDALFKEWDFENTDWILPLVRKCISISPGEREMVRALEISLCFYLKKFSVEDLEEELFRIACPAAEKLVVEKLSYLEKNPAGCVESLTVLIQILSYFERVFEFFSEIPKTALIEVRSLLIATFEILLSCFSHCKKSEEVYGSLFSSLTECLSNFFKKCCNLQEQLLLFLTEKGECDVEDDREILLLDELMSSLSKLGIILINLEVKTMARVWKAFAFLIEKHLLCLKTEHNIGETIKNLSDNIIISLETLNHKDFNKTIKLSCFLLKLIIKFAEVFVEQLRDCQNSLLNLLLMLCRFDAGVGVEASGNQDLMKQLTIGTDPLLLQLMTDVGFIKECHGLNEEVKKTVEFSILCSIIVRKLMDCNGKTRSLWLNENENILKWIFISVSSGHFITSTEVRLPHILINGKQKKFTDLYEYTLVTTTAFLMTASAEEYRLVESTLIQNILQTNPMKALFATDVWCLLARFADSELCFSHVITLSKTFQEIHPQTSRIEKCFLRSLIRRLFPLLAGNHRGMFLKSFQPSFYAALWDGSALGASELAPNEVSDVLQTVFAEVDPLLDQNYIGSFEMGMTTGRHGALFGKFGSKILKLWKFNCDVLSSTVEKMKFLKIITALTAILVADMPSENLLMVLTQIKKLLEIGQPTCVKLFFIWILSSLSTVRVPAGNWQKPTITTIAELFRELLSSKEAIVKQKAFETFYSFSHVTSHGEVIGLSVQNSPELKLEITDYFKRKPPDETDFNLKDYFRELSRLKFEHVCPQTDSEEVAVVAKKSKPNLREVIKRWKEDGKIIVEHFYSTTDSERRELKRICDSILSAGF